PGDGWLQLSHRSLEGLRAPEALAVQLGLAPGLCQQLFYRFYGFDDLVGASQQLGRKQRFANWLEAQLAVRYGSLERCQRGSRQQPAILQAGQHRIQRERFGFFGSDVDDTDQQVVQVDRMELVGLLLPEEIPAGTQHPDRRFLCSRWCQLAGHGAFSSGANHRVTWGATTP